MSTEDMQGEVRDLKAKLQNYQAGSIEGLNSFKDAREGEMEGMQIKVAVFGMTGVGKSSLVNTIWKVLYGKETASAIEQASGGEGTQILEEFHSRSASDSELGGFVFSDTRGFNFDFNNAEENELFRVLYGIESSGQHLERGEWAEEMAKEAGQAAHRLKKPPLADQVHVALWVIKGNDIRFENDQYIDKFAFVQQKLNREGVTIVTAVTHFDKLKSKNKNEVRRKAMEVTGSSRGNTFLFANWLPEEEDYDVQNQLEVLRMLKTALACGERSVKSRQVTRKLDKK